MIHMENVMNMTMRWNTRPDGANTACTWHRCRNSSGRNCCDKYTDTPCYHQDGLYYCHIPPIVLHWLWHLGAQLYAVQDQMRKKPVWSFIVWAVSEAENHQDMAHSPTTPTTAFRPLQPLSTNKRFLVYSSWLPPVLQISVAQPGTCPMSPLLWSHPQFLSNSYFETSGFPFFICLYLSTCSIVLHILLWTLYFQVPRSKQWVNSIHHGVEAAQHEGHF